MHWNFDDSRLLLPRCDQDCRSTECVDQRQQQNSRRGGHPVLLLLLLDPLSLPACPASGQFTA